MDRSTSVKTHSCFADEEDVQVPHLLFVPHGALSSDHDLAACFCLQLLRRETSWPQNPAYEIILQRERNKILVLNRLGEKKKKM